MGNGAKAQQRRDRAAKDGKKEPSSQLKSVCLSFLSLLISFRQVYRFEAGVLVSQGFF